MKVPTEIQGQNKLRDAMIIKLYQEGFSAQEIIEARSLKIGVRRIEQILYVNRALVKIDKEWEDTKQIHRIKRRIAKADVSKKDVYDWEALLDNKLMPKKIEHSGISTGETKVVVYVENKQDADKSASRRLPTQISVEPS